MALYRNIAGANDDRIGLTLYQSPTLTVQPTGSSYLLDQMRDREAWQQQMEATQATYEATQNSRYDWLMSHSYSEITAAGYYVEMGGSIFQWTDGSLNSSTVYLSLDWIQKIENERGTAGALLLHMQEPALAKDTAGYAGGSSATWYESGGVDPTTEIVTIPISEVQTLPPVVTNPDGSVTFDNELPSNGFPAPTTTAPTTTTIPTTTTTTPTSLPVDPATALKNNLLPLAAIAGVLFVAVAGDELPRKNLFFLGGVGALFFFMAKKQQ